ncbi:MAG: P1 family peptidase [Desulfotomaculales bacterium]
MGNFLPDPAVKVGHATDLRALTGCTVILVEDGAVGGVDIRGSAPGSRETELLRPLQRVEKVHAVLLTGGSAFGLEAADGVMAWLEERGIGFETGVARVPIVPAAVLFDLGIGDPRVRPGREMGYAACQNALSGEVAEGNVGAGTGATVGKALGMAHCTKSGLGAWWDDLGGGLLVGSVVAVNALGDVLDEKGGVLAGPRDPVTGKMLSTLDVWKKRWREGIPPKVLAGFNETQENPGALENTTLAVVVTNACLSKEEANKVAQMANAGLARCIEPVHTMYDGDTVFALATGKVEADVNLVGAASARVLETAVRRAVRAALSAGGVPGCLD